MNDGVGAFRDAIISAGLEPPDVIEPGKWHRFPGVGKSNGNTAGYCMLFDDGLGGCFGDYSSDYKENWQAKRDKSFTAQERRAYRRQLASSRARVEDERKARQAEAATKAAEIWNAATPAPDDHAYLKRKGIKASGARIHEDRLLIPVREGDDLHSLQFIEQDGEKRFHPGGRIKGCYYIIGSTENACALCITEGFATGATIHEATGHPVVVAFAVNRLLPVARAMKDRFPSLPLVVCADDDAGTEGNPGLTKASEAAHAVGGLLAVPDFGTERRDGLTDFNDMAKLSGLESVREAVGKATAPSSGLAGSNTSDTQVDDEWPDPQPLVNSADPVPYPLDALPETIREAVEEVQGFTKAPVSLVAGSALAALSLANQSHADARRAEGLEGPVSLFLLTVADSGERKSTCDRYFTEAIRDYEATQTEAASPARSDHSAALGAWKARQGGIRDKIRQHAKSNKPTGEWESQLRDLERQKPEPPKVPRLLYTDATPEALEFALAYHWPSGGVVSAEAGLVFGAHGMGKDSVMRNLALLNVLWDGGELNIDRRTSESFAVRGVRLTVGLQVQETVLRSFLERSGELARGSGFLARLLFAVPESTQGCRLFTEPPASWPALAAFNQRMASILGRPAPLNENGTLSPQVLSLTPDAKAEWVKFHDAIEGQLASGGELHDLRDVASKAADNAVRLAALFHVFERSGGDIGMEAFEAGRRLAAWYLEEARRFFGELALSPESADALQLDQWLVKYCERKKVLVVPRREVQRNVTPTHLRQRVTLDSTLGVLLDAGRARLAEKGRRKEIHLNPALIKDGAE